MNDLIESVKSFEYDIPILNEWIDSAKFTETDI